MKTISSYFCMTLAMLLTFSCNQVPEKSPYQTGTIEIEDAKSKRIDAFHQAYLDGNFDSQIDLFTEDAVIHINADDVSAQDMISGFGAGSEFYENIQYKDWTTATMHLDDGKVYTNLWYIWSATSKATGVTLNNPVHTWMRWEGDKIAEAAFILNPTEYIANMTK